MSGYGNVAAQDHDNSELVHTIIVFISRRFKTRSTVYEQSSPVVTDNWWRTGLGRHLAWSLKSHPTQCISYGICTFDSHIPCKRERRRQKTCSTVILPHTLPVLQSTVAEAYHRPNRVADMPSFKAILQHWTFPAEPQHPPNHAGLLYVIAGIATNSVAYISRLATIRWQDQPCGPEKPTVPVQSMPHLLKGQSCWSMFNSAGSY